MSRRATSSPLSVQPTTLMEAEDDPMVGSDAAFSDVDMDGESSGLDDGSGDDYVEEDDDGTGKRAAEQPVDNSKDDAIFQRIAGYVSGGAPQQGDGFGGASFQQELATLDEEELPQSSKRAPRRRFHKAHRPTYDVQQLLGRANMAYITQDHSEAAKLFLEVIRHDPHVHAAWSTLSTIYKEMGDLDQSRQMRFCSAHIEEDIGTWRELADEFRAEGNMNESLYCLRKAVKMDSSRSDILWQLVEIYRTMGKNNKAVDAFRKIHRAEPAFLRDFNLLMEIHPLILETKQYAFGATAFGDAFMWHFATFDSPTDETVVPEGENTMNIEHIVTYVDYLLKAGDPESAVGAIHRGQRWLQGRKSEKAWDASDDDLEYQPPRDPDDTDTEGPTEGNPLDNQLRYRLAIVRLRLGQDDEAMIHVNVILQLDAMIHGQMFEEMGEALMKRGLWEAALECWAALHERNVDDSPMIIFKLGVCQHQLKRNAEALESLKWVVDNDKHNIEARLALASVLEDMGNKAEALEIVSEVIRAGGDPHWDGTQSKGERAAAHRLNKRVLEAQAAQTMQGLWEDVRDAEEGINNGEPWALDQFIQSAGTMIETYRLAKSNFTKNRGITRVAKRRKYGSKTDITSQAMAMQDRLERTLGFEDETPLDLAGKNDYEIVRQTQFYGIEVEDWLALCIKYCCVLMVKNEEDVAMDILEHVIWSGLFNSRRCEIALRLTLIACSTRIQAYDRIVDNCKRLSQMHQFRPEPLLLMLACLGGGMKAAEASQNLALQKFMHREVRIYDEAVSGIKLRYNTRHKRWAQIITAGQSRRLGDFVEEDADSDNSEGAGESKAARPAAIEGAADGDEDDDEGDDEDRSVAPSALDPSGVDEEHDCPKPTKYSPTFNTLYGQNMLTTKSYQSALFYFFRAYDINPYDPYLCFLIAQAFFGRALNRQSDNRNYQISQGLVFLTRYRKLSPSDDQSQEEVEYNYGRAFHGLGIAHLAVAHYERVLDSVRRRMEAAPVEEREDIRQNSMAWESAHNLVLIYSASGSLDLVRSRSDEWLALVE